MAYISKMSGKISLLDRRHCKNLAEMIQRRPIEQHRCALCAGLFPPLGKFHFDPSLWSLYSSTSSARASTVAGISMPSALAVLRFSTS
jgi:hypothetical protein